MFCKNCGNKLSDEANFCNSCGTKFEQPQPTTNEVNHNVDNVETPPPQPPQPNTPPKVNQQPQYNTAQSYNAFLSQLDKAPLSVIQYIGMFLLVSIPIVGIVLLFVWGFGDHVNLNKKNFARAMLILSLIGVIVSIIFGAILVGIITQIINNYGLFFTNQ